ncbi:Plant lipid transfer protein/Par allergen [Corchorus olitorius]|uniref:Plant lipid transfer protein/Par allergen n=1 Tax=Corchorus olitorius TaxID=93759 RepID=A0A1R3J203_9ROSI|nr:Plant lipid transfer protein/Par allergen [Corchorus olitorius]
MAAHNLKLVCMVAMLCMLVLDPKTTAALSCWDVQKLLSPCAIYIFSLGTKNEDKCCDGVRNLNEMSLIPNDHRDACKCIKSQLGDFIRNRNRKDTDSRLIKIKSLAKGFLGKCGVNVPYEISDSTNCDEPKLLPSLSSVRTSLLAARKSPCGGAAAIESPVSSDCGQTSPERLSSPPDCSAVVGSLRMSLDLPRSDLADAKLHRFNRKIPPPFEATSKGIQGRRGIKTGTKHKYESFFFWFSMEWEKGLNLPLFSGGKARDGGFYMVADLEEGRLEYCWVGL